MNREEIEKRYDEEFTGTEAEKEYVVNFALDYIDQLESKENKIEIGDVVTLKSDDTKKFIVNVFTGSRNETAVLFDGNMETHYVNIKCLVKHVWRFTENIESSKPVDKVTTTLLQKALSYCNLQVASKTLDKFIDVFELLENKGDNVSFKDLDVLKKEWKK